MGLVFGCSAAMQELRCTNIVPCDDILCQILWETLWILGNSADTLERRCTLFFVEIYILTHHISNPSTMPTRKSSPGCRHTRQRGFTLIEICMTLFILVVGLLPIVGLLLTARHLDQQAQVQGIAYHAAWDELETLRAQVAGNRLLTTQSSFPIADTITQSYPVEQLTGTYSVTSVPGLGDSTHGVQQIAVQVSWNNSSAAGTPASSERISTYLSTGAGQ